MYCAPAAGLSTEYTVSGLRREYFERVEVKKRDRAGYMRDSYRRGCRGSPFIEKTESGGCYRGAIDGHVVDETSDGFGSGRSGRH